MTGLFGQLWTGKRDVILVLGMICILVILFTPIPGALLDFLLVLNFTAALLVLLITFFTDTPLAFSTFPSLLLITTLFRLALNISATRLILDKGNAGRVINAIGSYVVGGNYVIGLVVFLILVVVQYVVVTNGAQRVAEVAARFTLDSMPGKQMSIDADMNMGLIDEHEAKRRRSHVEKEASFYGAMDGATKFVKGDAIAGIMIILIDIIGGLTVGMVQKGLPWTESVHRYTLLTVGDGIVTQIPSLVIAVATGIIITRAATDAQLGTEIARQVLSSSRTLLIVSLALAGLLVLPGLPAWPVLLVLVGVATLTFFASRSGTPVAEKKEDASEPLAKREEEDLYRMLSIEPVEVHLGSSIAATYKARNLDLGDRISTFRKQFAMDFGFILPKVKLVQGSPLAEDAYEIQVQGSRVGRGELRFDALLAINPGGKRPKLEGRETRDPAYGLPAQWISPDQRQYARGAGYTLVDPETVLITHLGEVTKRHAPELLTRAETERLVARVREQQASLVDELIPGVMSYTDVQKVLQQLLREQVSIRNVETILEVLVDAGKTHKQTEDLVERVRERLGPSICQRVSNAQGELHVLTLAPELERSIVTAIRQREGAAGGLIADLAQLEALLSGLAKQSEAMMARSHLPVLLCPSVVRRHLRALIQRSLPHVTVLGINEVPSTVMVKAFGTVTASTAAAA
ncbi:flagellar biosynthesis protein FlhA [Dyella caseinilytica]|uniref:FHIPEP family type III secretion protein n=1 Tax=Dyella caseinilytica TaxID=1849581 RepID=A0ABX7GNT1_9GAMM|nr:flagellar biosynthesis protein FlhA [Dyella caseinilytica]QRN52072.1 FHIPEP family type III secretion protein [Dyella caseinilytica]GGA15662.1 flagellar biosynthesis protein FlhA [Dyella caseinilytica]